jgi:hypothetical protein
MFYSQDSLYPHSPLTEREQKHKTLKKQTLEFVTLIVGFLDSGFIKAKKMYGMA